MVWEIEFPGEIFLKIFQTRASHGSLSPISLFTIPPFRFDLHVVQKEFLPCAEFLCASVFDLCSVLLLQLRKDRAMLKLVPPSTPHPSRTKTCALVAFRAVRTVQAKAAQIPCVLLQARNDISDAWKESEATSPNA